MSRADPAAEHCTQREVQYFADARTLFARNSTFVDDVAPTYEECQFRFYDNNDKGPDKPEVPHVFTDKDYVLGGLFLWESYHAKDRPDRNRSEATEILDGVTIHVFFGPATTPGADLPELRLTHTRYRVGVCPETGDPCVWKHVYKIFPAGSLAPGEYKWRHEVSGLFDEVIHGSVTIKNG